MIYYFSGTGNSLRIAKSLSEDLNDKLFPINYGATFSSPCRDEERIGFVFPVYGWGLPRVVNFFIHSLPDFPPQAHTYVYAVLTCGDDIGKTDVVLRNALKAKGWPLSAVFSIQMRNTYICLPGFDVDKTEIVHEKERVATSRLKRISKCIELRETSQPQDVNPGDFAWLKSYVLRPLFNAFLISPRHFHVTPELCTHCGRCARICPLNNIELSELGTPEWKDHCTHCLACYHGCPHHAIEYGFFTKRKGQVKINI